MNIEKASYIPDDAELMSLIAVKDANAFSKLTDIYMKDVFRFSFSIVKDKSLAEDITQEVFIKVWKGADSWQPTGKVKSWLFKIAHNLAIDEIRKTKNHENIDEVDGEFESYQTLPDEIIHKKFLKDTITDALLSLPERQRTAIMLSYYSELSNKEGAEIMNVSVDAYESLLARGKKSLKSVLNNIKDKI